jgi:hypothetical protein
MKFSGQFRGQATLSPGEKSPVPTWIGWLGSRAGFSLENTFPAPETEIMILWLFGL